MFTPSTFAMDAFPSSRRRSDDCCSSLNIINNIPQQEQEPVSNTTASPPSTILTTRTTRLSSSSSLHNKHQSFEGSSDSIMIRNCHEPPAATLSTCALLLMQPDDPTFLLRRCLRYDWDSVGRLLECMNDLLSCYHFPNNDYYVDCIRNQLVQTEVDGNNPLQVCCHFEPPVRIIRLFRRVLRKTTAAAATSSKLKSNWLAPQSQSYYTNHQHQTALLIACDHGASIPVIRELLFMSVFEKCDNTTTTSDQLQQADRLLSRHDVDHRNVFDSLYDRSLRTYQNGKDSLDSETEFLLSSQRCLSSLLFPSPSSGGDSETSNKLTTDLWKLILDMLKISNVTEIYPSLARHCHLLPSELVDALVSVAVVSTEEKTKNDDISTDAWLYTLMQVRIWDHRQEEQGGGQSLSSSSTTIASLQKKRQAYVCQQLLLRRTNYPEQEPLSTDLVLYAIRQGLSYQHDDEDGDGVVRLLMDHCCPDEVDKILPQALLVAAAHNTVDTTYRLLQTDPSMIQNDFCKYDKAK